jgi:DNA-directed RNA polymerase subunit N (RpoN/RPB10)
LVIPIRADQCGKIINIRCTHCGKNNAGIKVPYEKTFKDQIAQNLISPKTVIRERGEQDSILKLHVKQNEFHAEQFFSIEKETTIVGRKATTSNAEIQIETKDRNMSREHIILKKKSKGRFVLADNSSSNGTFLDEVQLEENEEVYLEDGNIICIGKTEINIRIF